MLKQYGLFASLHKYLMVKQQSKEKRTVYTSLPTIPNQRTLEQILICERKMFRDKWNKTKFLFYLLILFLFYWFFFWGVRVHLKIFWSNNSNHPDQDSLGQLNLCVQIRSTLNVLAYHIGLDIFTNEAKLKTGLNWTGTHENANDQLPVLRCLIFLFCCRLFV